MTAFARIGFSKVDLERNWYINDIIRSKFPIKYLLLYFFLILQCRTATERNKIWLCNLKNPKPLIFKKKLFSKCQSVSKCLNEILRTSGLKITLFWIFDSILDIVSSPDQLELIKVLVLM